MDDEERQSEVPTLPPILRSVRGGVLCWEVRAGSGCTCPRAELGRGHCPLPPASNFDEERRGQLLEESRDVVALELCICPMWIADSSCVVARRYLRQELPKLCWLAAPQSQNLLHIQPHPSMSASSVDKSWKQTQSETTIRERKPREGAFHESRGPHRLRIPAMAGYRCLLSPERSFSVSESSKGHVGRDVGVSWLPGFCCFSRKPYLKPQEDSTSRFADCGLFPSGMESAAAREAASH